MTTVTKLCDELVTLIAKGHGDLEVIACHGASGAYDPTGGVYLTEVEEGDDDLLELPEGTKFVCLYTGN